ncbi:MAG: hypothetical protein VYA17_10925 [Pseudomonadota bacterium]|nr:hypothetical protein [Pseudomonadota bacterium]
MISERAAAELDEAPAFWFVGPVEAPFLVENVEAVLPLLPYFVTGWDIQWSGATSNLPADIRVIELADGGFRVNSAGLGGTESVFKNSYDAAKGLAAALINQYVARDPTKIGLKTGAALVDGGLVVIIDDSLVGSGLPLHLTALGNKFFGDVQIAVKIEQPFRGICLGLTPEVRLPLPEECGILYREFVEGYTCMERDGRAYLKLWDREASVFGETAPIQALVFLDRRKRAAARLCLTDDAGLMKRLLPTALAPHIPYCNLISALKRLFDETEAYHLHYSNSRDAATLLSRRFGKKIATHSFDQ